MVRTPYGYPQQIPYVSIAQGYLKTMSRFAEQFGLTPAARSRIIAGTGADGALVDEMDELLGSGPGNGSGCSSCRNGSSGTSSAW